MTNETEQQTINRFHETIDGLFLEWAAFAERVDPNSKNEAINKIYMGLEHVAAVLRSQVSNRV